jgi:hypothetical protein
MPAAIIRLRRNTSVEWSALNPLLLSGEMAYETDTQKFRIGDGVTRYDELDYYLPATDFQALINEALANAGAGDGGAAMAALNAHITSLTPHSAYDDGPSLTLLYQNAKV